MDDLKGYDEVFSLLLEHSFRHFGPAAEITQRIIDNSSWNPSVDPNENNLLRMVDLSSQAHLTDYYTADFYLFDSFVNKAKFELENSKHTPITSDRLHELKFDEEELRKVMSNLGHLLLKERSLISGQSSSYDFLSLYFQIKKLWSILITVRYLDERLDIGQIKMQIQKAFLIRALQEFDKANMLIKTYLLSFDQIYQSKESVEKHIDEFFREYMLRYLQCIIIGLTHFQAEFLLCISSKSTWIDRISDQIKDRSKGSLNAIQPSNAFHCTLVAFLRVRTNDLKTEKQMEQFIEIIEEQRNQMLAVQPVLAGLENNELADERAANPFEEQLNNDPNLNDLSLNDNMDVLVNGQLVNGQLMNGQLMNGQLNDLLDDMGDHETFSLSAPREDDQNTENSLNESMNQDDSSDANQPDVAELENSIDDPYQQIDDLMNSDPEKQEDSEQSTSSIQQEAAASEVKSSDESLGRGKRPKKPAKKRLQISASDSEENEDNKRPRLDSTVQVADEETIRRILCNQPKIVLKHVGLVQYNGKLVPIYD